jgi:hypothetical protein
MYKASAVRNFAATFRGAAKRFILVCAAVAGLLGAVSAVHPSAADASAKGCTLYGKPAWANFCGEINGSGLYVQNIEGAYAAGGLVGWLCNARLEVQFINTSGGVYATYLSSLQSGCNAAGGWGWTINANARAGTIRFTVLSNGATIAAVQETIKS